MNTLARVLASAARRCCLVLLLTPVVLAVELNFQPVILDPSYIAYERDVGDIDGDGANDLVAVQEGGTTLQVFRAPPWTRSTLLVFAGAYQYTRADDFKLADIDNNGDLDIVGIRSWNSAPTYIYRKVQP